MTKAKSMLPIQFTTCRIAFAPYLMIIISPDFNQVVQSDISLAAHSLEPDLNVIHLLGSIDEGGHIYCLAEVLVLLRWYGQSINLLTAQAIKYLQPRRINMWTSLPFHSD